MTCLDPARWCKESMFLREGRGTGHRSQVDTPMWKKEGVPSGFWLLVAISICIFLDIVSLCFYIQAILRYCLTSNILKHLVPVVKHL